MTAPAQANIRYASLTGILSGIVGVCLVAAFAPAVAQTEADSAERPPVVWELRAPSAVPADLEQPEGFYAGHLLPRMSRNLERWSGAWLTDHPAGLRDDVVYTVYSEAARREVYRATRRALTDYLLEETSLSRVVDRFSGARIAQVKGGERRGGSVKWDFGLSHGLPVVEMRYPIGGLAGGELKFSAGLQGRLGIDFRAGHRNRTSLRARYNLLEDEYSLGANFQF